MEILLTSNKLESILEESQKRAKTRTITLLDIKEAIEEIENNLNCTKRSLNGSKIYVDVNAQQFPSAYKYTPISTLFTAIYKNNKWYITDISRGTCTNKKYKIILSDEAKENILQNIAIGKF